MKRRLKKLQAFVLGVFVFFAAMLFCVAAVAIGGQNFARIGFSKSYYFLIVSCTATSAVVVSGDIYASGGAGYYMEEENAVAIACYFKETSAQSVQRNLQAKGTQTELVKRSAANLVFRGKKSGYKQQIESTLETVDLLAHILYDTANGLERSELTQKQAKAAVEGVASSLSGLRGVGSDEFFFGWNTGLSEAERRAKELSQGLLFSKDLRYLQAMLCDKIVRMADYFA